MYKCMHTCIYDIPMYIYTVHVCILCIYVCTICKCYTYMYIGTYSLNCEVWQKQRLASVDLGLDSPAAT